MAKDEVEVERKYDVAPDTELPRLQDVPGVARVEQPVVGRMEATYFDTRDLALVGVGITLRRRVGGEDQGWHLKVPGVGEQRVEMHLPLARGIRTVPHEFRSMLRGVTGLADETNLRPVARVRTTRTVRVLRDKDGEALAEFCDDEVEARAFRIVDSSDEPSTEDTWREWEVELVDGHHELLDQVGRALLQAGARESEHTSKLRRALGPLAPQPGTTPPDPHADQGTPSPRQVIQARISEQAQRIIQLDPAVRRDSPGSVHQMRVAARRLRSALATYRPLLQRDQTEPLRDDLQHLGRALGDARDLEVLDERLTGLLEAEGWVDHPFAHHLAEELAREREQARTNAIAELESPRHEELLVSLRRLADQPPWAEDLDWAEVVQRVRKDYKRVRRRMRAAGAAQTQMERLHLLHEARKAAKRLRYAAEALIPAFHDDAERLAKTVKELQSHLGDIQDAAVSRERLLGAASRAREDGIDTFPAGVLWAREDEAIRSADAEVPAVWKKAKRKKRRAWLSA